jgi:hypothetical protein
MSVSKAKADMTLTGCHFRDRPESDISMRAASSSSSERLGGAGVFKAGGDTQKSRRPPAILRATECPRALQPTSQEFRRCHFLQRLEHGFCLTDLSDTDEIQHDVAG